jgi:hypothetical protein
MRFICKLRKKLANASQGKNYIETVWGRGYVLREPTEEVPIVSRHKKTPPERGSLVRSVPQGGSDGQTAMRTGRAPVQPAPGRTEPASRERRAEPPAGRRRQ